MLRPRLIIIVMAFAFATAAMATTRIFAPTVKSLQAIVDDNWTSPLVVQLGSQEVINISFDELSHDYHRYTYHLEHCEWDWATSADIFDSDFIQGFNDNLIDDYEKSINTNIAYTHYWLQLPNDRCQFTMSGNYKLSINDDDSGERVAEVRFMVVDPEVSIDMSLSSNTDIDINQSHQQLSLALDYSSLKVTNPSEQLKMVVKQNDCDHGALLDVEPNLIGANTLKWEHNRQLIFNAGNEYRKYEVLSLSHSTMGIDHIEWDGSDYHVFPFADEPRKNYLTDVSANGYWLVRNSDNQEVDYTCDYAYVHFQLFTPRLSGTVYVDGQWATDNNSSTYAMDYDEEAQAYRATILQKQGYYSYRYMLKKADGTLVLAPTEGNFYQTANSYQAYVYYKGKADRTWGLVGWRNISF